jgi:hypothetical protein
VSVWVQRLRAFEQKWTHGRRVLAPAAVLVVIAGVAASALVATADEPRPAKAAAATTRPARPHYLVPIGALVRQGWLPAPTLTGDEGSVGVPPGTPKPPATPDPTRAAQQAPAIAPYRGPDGTITPAGIATLALEHGCAPDAAVIATAIAMAESGGSPSAQGDVGLMTPVWDWSAGLWQIRGLRAERNTGGLRDSVANQGIEKNAAAMHTISQGCTDWTPWSTYNTGAYQRFLSLARQAVSYVVRWFDAHGSHYPPVSGPDPTATIPAGGSGAAPAAPARAGSSAGRPRSAPARPAPHRTTAAPAARSTAAGGPAPTAASSPAAGAAKPSRTGGGLLPLPRPTSSTSTKHKPPLPLPTSSLPVPLPLPTLPLPLP